MNTFEVVKNLLVHRCQFFIQYDNSVFIGLFAFLRVRAARAILTDIYFFLSAVFVVLNGSSIELVGKKLQYSRKNLIIL